jgi:hypothetical protein
MDSVRLTRFYREVLGDICKDYLDQAAFMVGISLLLLLL